MTYEAELHFAYTRSQKMIRKIQRGKDGNNERMADMRESEVIQTLQDRQKREYHRADGRVEEQQGVMIWILQTATEMKGRHRSR